MQVYGVESTVRNNIRHATNVIVDSALLLLYGPHMESDANLFADPTLFPDENLPADEKKKKTTKINEKLLVKTYANSGISMHVRRVLAALADYDNSSPDSLFVPRFSVEENAVPLERMAIERMQEDGIVEEKVNCVRLNYVNALEKLYAVVDDMMKNVPDLNENDRFVAMHVKGRLESVVRVLPRIDDYIL
jgi:hypothetical protein